MPPLGTGSVGPVVNGRFRARRNATLRGRVVVGGLEQVRSKAWRTTTLCGGEVVGGLDCMGYSFGSGPVPHGPMHVAVCSVTCCGAHRVPPPLRASNVGLNGTRLGVMPPSTAVGLLVARSEWGKAMAAWQR